MVPFGWVLVFGMWETKARKKNRKEEFFFVKQRLYWKTKSVQKLTRKATNTDSIFNTEYRATQEKKKKHKTQTKIKETSCRVFLETKPMKEK